MQERSYTLKQESEKETNKEKRSMPLFLCWSLGSSQSDLSVQCHIASSYNWCTPLAYSHPDNHLARPRQELSGHLGIDSSTSPPRSTVPAQPRAHSSPVSSSLPASSNPRAPRTPSRHPAVLLILLRPVSSVVMVLVHPNRLGAVTKSKPALSLVPDATV